MTVLFKNLTARIPNAKDRAVLAELVHLCERSEEGSVGSVLEDLLSEWQQPDSHQANDAWVIVTTSGQLVGFACVWREEHERITTYLCVHPEYRCRGIGTLLLRMVEMRARQLMRQFSAGQRVVLQGLMNSANIGAQRLFAREGYRMGRTFLRISCALNEEDEDGQQHVPVVARKFTVEVDLEQRNQPLAATSLTERDVLCSVHRYLTYEKELRAASDASHVPADLQALSA